MAATGGAAVEIDGSVKARGPQRFRHRDRALSAQDFAWLAREASPAVARARCLPITGPAGPGQRGWVTVLVVPHGAEGSPLPSPELTPACARVPGCAGPGHGRRTNPRRGSTLRPGRRGRGADPASRVSRRAHWSKRLRDRLNRFLHPLTGGPAQAGWDFGQTVHLSQIASLIEGTSGVDYARELHLEVDGRLYAEVRTPRRGHADCAGRS